MAASMFRGFLRTKSTISWTILRSPDVHCDLNGCKSVLSYAYASGSSRSGSFPKYDEDTRRTNAVPNRLGGRPHRRFAEEERDEYSEHHLAENTASKLDQLSRQHREGRATSEHVTEESKTFSDLPLDPALVKRLDELGYKTPFAIQTRTLEYTLNSRDVIGRAVTGSGKTLAFAIPIVNKLRQSDRGIISSNRKPRAIVMSPTRELCNQIYRSIQELDNNVRCVALYGGASYERQERELSRGVDVICATPGRLNDHIDRGNIDLKQLEFLCLDEADEMLTPNFREQINDIFEDSPKDKQVLMFSATMPSEVRQIAQRYLRNPEFVDITDGKKSQAPEGIEHQCMKASSSQHVAIVANLLAEHDAQRCIVFLNTKVRTNGFAQSLKRHGLKAEAINSDLSQNRRESILSAFRLGDLKILCATDVAARGLDIPETDLIVQVGPPDKGLEFYLHRSGRTGRAGRKGLAVLLHSGYPAEMDIINQISRSIPFQHVSVPEKLTDVLRENNLQRALDNLKKVSQKDIDGFLPTAQKLFDESRQDGTSLMAAALSLLSHSSAIVDVPPSGYSSFDRERRWDRGSPSSKFSSNYENNRRNSSTGGRNRRQQFMNVDNDDDDDEVDIRRFR